MGDGEDAPEPIFTSLKDRIAALNAANAKSSGNGHVAPARSTAPASSSNGNKPSPPARPASSKPTASPAALDTSTSITGTPAGLTKTKPPLPPGRPRPPVPPRVTPTSPPHADAKPPLPSREAVPLRPSVPTRQPSLPSRPVPARKGSDTPVRHIPPPPDEPPRTIPPPSQVPAPATRAPPLPTRHSPTLGHRRESHEAPALPTRRDSYTTPALPPRKGSVDTAVQAPRRLPPTAKNEKQTEEVPPLPGRTPPPLPTSSRPRVHDDQAPPSAPPKSPSLSVKPPPIPLHSRPTIPTPVPEVEPEPEPQLEPEPQHIHNSDDSDAQCLICRDFSSADTLAAQHPVSTIPRSDPVGYLAETLCSPFPSATDKARAIFVWLHYNVAYDFDNFQRGTVPHKTTEETIFSGLAVCQGYADVFRAIAQAAGLECILISGHGKGYGYVARGIVPFDSNHAWNAVLLEDEWKLIDSCWGAGVCTNNGYEAKFNPWQFTMPNEEFGHRHFPSDGSFFVDSPPTWEEYITSWNAEDLPMVYTAAADEGINSTTLQPATRQLTGSGMVRFLVSKVCPHWDQKRQSKLLLLVIHDQQGKMDTLVPQTDGFWWWWDLAVGQCGRPGEQVLIAALDTWDGRDATWVTAEAYRNGKGRTAYSFQVLVSWDIA